MTLFTSQPTSDLNGLNKVPNIKITNNNNFLYYANNPTFISKDNFAQYFTLENQVELFPKWAKKHDRQHIIECAIDAFTESYNNVLNSEPLFTKCMWGQLVYNRYTDQTKILGKSMITGISPSTLRIWHGYLEQTNLHSIENFEKKITEGFSLSEKIILGSCLY